MIRFWDRLRKTLRSTPDEWTPVRAEKRYSGPEIDWPQAEQELARWNRERGTHLPYESGGR